MYKKSSSKIAGVFGVLAIGYSLYLGYEYCVEKIIKDFQTIYDAGNASGVSCAFKANNIITQSYLNALKDSEKTTLNDKMLTDAEKAFHAYNKKMESCLKM
jgi:hypothetical protein